MSTDDYGLEDFGPHLWQNAAMRAKALDARLANLAVKREEAMHYVTKGQYMGWYPFEMDSAWKSLNDIQSQIEQVERFKEIF